MYHLLIAIFFGVLALVLAFVSFFAKFGLLFANPVAAAGAFGACLAMSITYAMRYVRSRQAQEQSGNPKAQRSADFWTLMSRVATVVTIIGGVLTIAKHGSAIANGTFW